MRRWIGLFVFVSGLILPACGGGGGGGGGAPPVQSGQTALRTLSGTIVRADGSGLAGVTVTAGNPSIAVTDAGGNFIVIDPDTGTIPVEIDGTTSTAAGSFPVLDLMVDIKASGATALQPITLPDLSNPASANDTAPVDVTGTTTAPTAVVNTAGDIRLDVPTGTAITIGGVPAAGTVNLNVTPVDAMDVPMPLDPPGMPLDAAGFVTIQPANAAFDTGAGQANGADVRLPNLRGFPVGAMLDIWSFDHDVGDWVNRSLQTGVQGTVMDLGGGLSAIDACGVITEGGWHTAVLPFAPLCGTTVTGRVLDQNSNPIADAHIALGTGQFGTTAADGTFSIPSVTTYDAASLPACVISGTSLRALAPVALGAASTTVAVAASTIVAGGTTNVGDVVIAVPTTGSLAGIVTDAGTGVAGATVSISGPTTTTATTGSTGTFFLANLAPGSYTASFQFAGAAAPTVRSFTITSNQITTLNLARITGTGSQTITVKVELGCLDHQSNHAVAPGAKVLLIGTDVGSAGGILGVTNSSGRVTFTNVNGPFTVTAQLDVLDEGESGRLATTLFAIAPSDGTIGVPLVFEGERLEGQQPVLDATLNGTVSNLPALGTNEGFSVDVWTADEASQFVGQGQVNPATGAYTVPVSSQTLLNVTFKHSTDGGLGGDARTLAAILAFGVGPVSAGGTATQNFDFNVGRVDFNRSVTMTYTNRLATPDDESVDLFIIDPSAAELSEQQFSVGVGSGLPGTIFLPSVSDSNLAGLKLDLEVEQSKNFFSTSTDCDIILTTNPTALTVRFESLPTVISPVDMSTLTKAQAAGMTVSFTEPAGGLANGLNAFFIDTDVSSGIAGLDFVSWTVFLPKGVTSATLPPSALPMFADSTGYSLELTLVRFAENPGNFNSIFNQNAFSNLATFLDSTARQCFADQDVNFSTGP